MRFKKSLTTASDVEAFDAVVDMYRNNAIASGAACNPDSF
jgi:hypothetical protein